MQNKYRNVKTVVNGIAFDSKKEAGYYLQLKMLESAGKITDLKMQVEFELIPKQYKERNCVYKADFTYVDADGIYHVVDVKGMKQRRPEYIIKRKLMLYKYGIRIEEI